MTERERDDQSGRYTDVYPPAEMIETIRELGGRAATSEIAESLDYSRDTAYKKLLRLEDRGDVDSKKTGGVRIWSVAENGD